MGVAPIDRDAVQIWTGDDMHFVATIVTIPCDHMEPTSKSTFTFEERLDGAPIAIQTRFNPGDTIGQEFVYSNSHAQASLAASTAGRCADPM